MRLRTQIHQLLILEIKTTAGTIVVEVGVTTAVVVTLAAEISAAEISAAATLAAATFDLMNIFESNHII
jgi:hypothetical protein